MSQKVFIPIVLGTAREGRQSEKVAQTILDILQNRDDLEVSLVDVKDHLIGHTIPSWEDNEATKPWRDIVSKAGGFILVVPEYNHGYPGELKLLLDQELEAYAEKPVALCTVSAGGFGGVRVFENLLPVLHELGLNVVHKTLPVSKVKEFKKDERFVEKVNDLADALINAAS